MAGGGLAIAVVPLLEGTLGWRAPYWSALVIALAVGLVLAVSPRDPPRLQGHAPEILVDRDLLRLAAVQTATFGFSVVLANWVVSLLTRPGRLRAAAAALGALILLGGIVTRPIGGLLTRQRPELAATDDPTRARGTALGTLALALPLPLVALGARRRPRGPRRRSPVRRRLLRSSAATTRRAGAAIAFVNLWAVLTILILVPVVGLSFSLPGEAGSASPGSRCSCSRLVVTRPRGRLVAVADALQSDRGRAAPVGLALLLGALAGGAGTADGATAGGLYLGTYGTGDTVPAGLTSDQARDRRLGPGRGMGQPVLGSAALARADPDARPERSDDGRGRDHRSAQVARGAGDAYLAALNQAISEYGSLVYVRPWPEMDGSWNVYCAYNANGSPRSAAHSTANFRKAFARMYLLLHGGTKQALDRACAVSACQA